jgi:glycosyltransferase involved in cell wall biosynthesis
LKLLIVHHHFRPGGVRRVIELATPHLVEYWPQRIRGVLLATGEAPDQAWLRAFRKRLRGTPVKVMVQAAFGYASELALDGECLRRRVMEAVVKLLRDAEPGRCVIWAHNLGLGRNLYLTRELTSACHTAGISLIAHHHDWWFENRWHHFTATREPGFRTLRAVANAVLADSPCIAHATINRADASVLGKYFPGRSGWLPNPVEPAALPPSARVEAARAWLSQQLGEDAPVWLLPCRLLRRKNIAEALLLARWLRPEAWLVTTGGVSSAEEQAYASKLLAAAQRHKWRLYLGILHGDENKKPSVPDLLAASEAVLLTSLQEGFGLPFLEAAALRRPLVARRLPNIAPDLARFGFKFPQCYREIWVDPSLFDWWGERERQKRLLAEWKSLMPRAARQLVGKPAVLAAVKESCPVPFSRLTLTAQLEVLAQPVGLSWEWCAPLNPELKRWREQATAARLEPSPWPHSAARWLGGRTYAQRFLKLVAPVLSKGPRAAASQAAQADLLCRKLSTENLYPLLWNSRT